jgi:hypothetical protein
MCYQDILEFRKKHAQLKVKLTDGTTKTLLVGIFVDSVHKCKAEIFDQKDISTPTIDVCKFIGDKILIKNGEEFGLQMEKTNDATHSILFPPSPLFVTCICRG